MIKIKSLIILLMFLGLLTACQTVKSDNNAQIDYAGVYTGTTPAASNPGINVKLTLNTDRTFKLVYEYIDREGIFVTTGKFSRDGDIIELDSGETYLPSYYKLGKNQLLQLDIDGNVITGEFADMYILKRE